ncbi:LuxR C-terminal-related transcriptional regulator [Caldicellulosiruptoraceae bacterium PP1]
MKQIQIYKEILLSHKRCTRYGINKSITFPLVRLKGNELYIRLKRNEKLIDIFCSCINGIKSQIKNDYIFLLIDCEGYLLDIKCNKKIYNCLDEQNFKVGMSFSEGSLGTNAISMAMKIKKTVYLKPNEHYCEILKKWYCIATPLLIDNMEIIGYIDISTIEKSIADEMILVIELLKDKIISEYNKKELGRSIFNINLTDKQLEILRMCAQGYKELSISIELGIEVATVKYHKKQIIKKLHVKNIQEAIAKATKLEVISVD